MQQCTTLCHIHLTRPVTSVGHDDPLPYEKILLTGCESRLIIKVIKSPLQQVN